MVSDTILETTSLKQCSRCLKKKPEVDFGWHKKSLNRRRTVCKPCRNSDARAWKKMSKVHVNRQVMDRHRSKKKFWVASFGGVCQDCGGEYPTEVYDFHHLNPEEKDKSMKVLFSYCNEKIEKELAKCVLLCANCHRIRHITNYVEAPPRS